MNKLQNFIFGIYLFSLSSFLFAEQEIVLWDLGMKIVKANPSATVSANVDKKFAALTKRHVKPQHINIESKNKPNNIDVIAQNIFPTLNYFEIFSLGNKYFIAERHVETIKLFEMVEFSKFNIKQHGNLMQLYADALFNLGHHARVINILTKNKEYKLNDELLFLLGMSSAELENKKMALHAFNEIIENHPSSEYQNIAKLQLRVLKR